MLFQKLFGLFEYSRSWKWADVRAAYIKLHPLCECCDSKNKLNVHHIIPYHINPAKELDMDNLMTLCLCCHLTFGHLMNWKSWNVNVRKDVAWFREKVLQRPMAKEDLTD